MRLCTHQFFRLPPAACHSQDVLTESEFYSPKKRQYSNLPLKKALDNMSHQDRHYILGVREEVLIHTVLLIGLEFVQDQSYGSPIETLTFGSSKPTLKREPA